VVSLLVGAMLSGCAPEASPPSPSPTASASPSASPSPTATATEQPSEEPSEPPVPPPDPPPQRVTGVSTQTGGGSGEVLVRWTQNPESDVVRYVVYRATTPGGTLSRIGTATPADVTRFEYVPFVDNTATVGYYRVRAVDAAGQDGPLSVEVCGASPGHSC
jgi:hypothetical protein